MTAAAAALLAPPPLSGSTNILILLNLNFEYYSIIEFAIKFINLFWILYAKN